MKDGRPVTFALHGFIEFKKALSPEQWTEFEAAAVNNPELLDAYPEAEFIWTAPLEDDPKFP